MTIPIAVAKVHQANTVEAVKNAYSIRNAIALSCSWKARVNSIANTQPTNDTIAIATIIMH